MALLIDLADEKVQSFLQRGRTTGSITYDELNSYITAAEVSTEDIDDTLNLLSEMGIEIADGRTQEERDREDDARLETMRAWTANGNPLPQLTGEAWASLLRAIERKKT